MLRHQDWMDVAASAMEGTFSNVGPLMAAAGELSDADPLALFCSNACGTTSMRVPLAEPRAHLAPRLDKLLVSVTLHYDIGKKEMHFLLKLLIEL